MSGLELGRYARRKDLTGQRFGKLTVIEMLYGYRRKKSGQSVTYCRCQCDCGNIVLRQAQKLKTSKMPSCGCAKKDIAREACGIDVDGKKFGRLTIIETLWDETPVKVRCMCECGQEVVIDKRDVLSGHTKSCGCLQRERAGDVNSKDFSGMSNQYKITALNRVRKNAHGVWLWEFRCHCGNHFIGLPARIFSKNKPITSCGCQIKSNGEQFVEAYLASQNVIYNTQITFPDCKYKNRLKFDFGVYDDSDNIIALIEYDGQQHFKPIDYFGGLEGFKKQQTRDGIKNKYCKENGILLCRIPYTYTAEQIINTISNIIYA